MESRNSSPPAALRTLEFWGRAVSIYGTYKVAQLQALGLKLLGRSDAEIQESVWVPQHTQAGEKMYELCISLRGFYLKVRGLYRTVWLQCRVWWQVHRARREGGPKRVSGVHRVAVDSSI